MFSRLFDKSRTVLDDITIQWQFDVFHWALSEFDAAVFFNETGLVLPDNAYFPGRENSAQGMAELIFNHVKRYAGVAHWPTRLLEQNACYQLENPRLQIAGALRGGGGIDSGNVAEENRLIVTYPDALVANPEALIASYAHTLAHYLGAMAKTKAPGGMENWPHITELLAVFLGFGVIFANNAYQFKAGCGGCSAGAPQRENYLSQHDVTYALAIFSVLKALPPKQVARQLKKSLRSFFLQAVKDAGSRNRELAQLRAFAA